MLVKKITEIVMLIKNKNCFLPSFSTCKCKFMSFSQTAATNEAWADISCEYVIVSPSCSPFTC